MLHLRDLQCFVSAYELRSFSRAANALDTVQSQVSLRIRRLERFMATPLFVRRHRGVEPTEKGNLLHLHAQRVLRDVADLETAVRDGWRPEAPALPATSPAPSWPVRGR
jgi:LysR family nitrogen assimilation transcriptional regulator